MSGIKLHFKIFILLFLFTGSSFANNIQIISVSLADQNTTTHTMNVQFNLSWENSFKDDINWDAAWIFVKYKTGSGEWNHATLAAVDLQVGFTQLLITENFKINSEEKRS